jgi:naphthoate synthase
MSAFVEKRPANYIGLREKAAARESSEFPWGSYHQSCSVCGAKYLPASFEFCGNCGADLNSTTVEEEAQSE